MNLKKGMVKMEFKDKIFNVEEVAELLQVSTKTVLRRIRANQLRASKIGKYWRITGEAINEYLKNTEHK